MRPRSLLIVVTLFAAVAIAPLLLGLWGEPGPARGAPTEAALPLDPGVARESRDSLTLPDIPPEARELMEQGRNWRAARLLRAWLRETPQPAPEALLLAARAEAAWGGWSNVRELLQDRSWLDTLSEGEGWYWLGRALEEADEDRAALDAYTRFLRARGQGGGPTELEQTAALRRGLILLRFGQQEEGAALLQEMRERAPDLTHWIDLLAAEALAARGDTARVRALVEQGDAGELGSRAQRALVEAYAQAGDWRGVRELSLRDESATSLRLRAARAALQLGDTAQAVEELRALARDEPGSSAAREAAALLPELDDIGRADQLALARVWDRHGNNARAARGYGAWLETGEGGGAQREEIRYLLGSALFDSGEYGQALAVLQPLAEGGGRYAARAGYLRGRAEFRRGNRERAMDLWLRTAERFPGDGNASEGLFLVADLSHDEGETEYAARIYRRVASEFAGTDRSGLSLMRLGGLAFLRGGYADAAAAWEEYRTRYPRGERWLEATYWAGRSHQEAGDLERAHALYRAAREREPLSYYALLSSQRLDQPWWPVPLEEDPPEDPAARQRVERWMYAIDVLRDAGLHDEAEAEADRWIERAGSDPALLYPLAETLIERGYTVRGIRIGLRLDRSGPGTSRRLLRILYPFPYREMIEAEAAEKGLDPAVVAALTRQESLFKARISSPVGARGLMQIMPETGLPLARAAGIQGWDPELLFQPEINVHLGTRYLAEQMRRYDGSLPSVFSAYNAGPHRIDQWRTLPEFGSEELFTERIPYRETRDYVKILTRNIALYEALYGDR